MSYTETVENSTLELIKSLQSRNYLARFHLVGGTALALYLGHRKSIDIDLSDWPVMIIDPSLKWAAVKKKIEKTVLNYLHGI